MDLKSLHALHKFCSMISNTFAPSLLLALFWKAIAQELPLRSCTAMEVKAMEAKANAATDSEKVTDIMKKVTNNDNVTDKTTKTTNSDEYMLNSDSEKVTFVPVMATNIDNVTDKMKETTNSDEDKSNSDDDKSISDESKAILAEKMRKFRAFTKRVNALDLAFFPPPDRRRG